jgi:hypothetical protein
MAQKARSMETWKLGKEKYPGKLEIVSNYQSPVIIVYWTYLIQTECGAILPVARSGCLGDILQIVFMRTCCKCVFLYFLCGLTCVRAVEGMVLIRVSQRSSSV